jgi:hypothetical protein
MGCCCGTSAVDEQREEQEREERARLLQPPRQVQGALQNVNVVNVQLPPIYYVIVGRGPMAVVNHRTLIQSQWGIARIGAYPVVHLGAPNPWPSYLQHGLGQPNHLLSFPGLAHQPSVGGNAIDGGLDSQHFGGQINAELNGILPARAPFPEWVALIQSRAAPNAGALDARIRDQDELGGDAVRDLVAVEIARPWPAYDQGLAPYRLCLYNPATATARLIYAAAIDICTGPGRPSVFAPGGGVTDEIRRARTPPWLSPELWANNPVWRDRKVFNGVDAIRDEVVWHADERVCVTAGGGVGLNAAEKGRNESCILDWFGRGSIMDIFDNPRNITFLRHPGQDNRCVPGPRAAVGVINEDHLIPFGQNVLKRVRMGCGATLTSATNVHNGVEVRLAVNGGFAGGARIRDWWRTLSLLDGGGFWAFGPDYTNLLQPLGRAPSILYDRLVIPNGQATDQPGHPHSFAHHLGFTAHEEAGRMVCLQTGDGLVRVLGAACNNYPGFGIGTYNADPLVEPVTAAQRMWRYHASLPVSAVPDGFIVCGANTALANRYFTDHPNTNVNTMTQPELRAIVGLARANRIIERRKISNGYVDRADLLVRCEMDDGAMLDPLTYAYPVIV